MGCLLLAACSEPQPQSAATVQPVFCYRTVDRSAPGVLVPGDPIPCSAGGERWRAQGRRDRPDAVELLGPDGQVRMGYRLGYLPSGAVAWEERRLRQRPTGLSVYELGRRYDFKTGPEDQWQEVVIRTELDPAGRPVLVTKRVAGRLEFKVERVYSERGLESESTHDGSGQLRLKSTFVIEDGVRYEEMRDKTGKLVLRRPAGGERELGPGRVMGSSKDQRP